MADIFAGGHLRYLNGAWRDDNGDPVEIEVVVHARWTVKSLTQIAPNCSNCGLHSIMRYPRCPYCGAHMDEEVVE